MLKPCKECGQEISSKAKICPKCGHDGPRAIPMVYSVIGGVIGYFVLIAFAIGSYKVLDTTVDIDRIFFSTKEKGIPLNWSYCRSDKSGFAPVAPAYRYAQEFVKDRLTSPSSAKFPDVVWDFSARSSKIFVDLVHTKPYEECTWKIRSYVDSTNAFGVTLQEDYTAKVKFNVSNATWYLVSLRFYEQ